jgi:hypothetical protein
MVAHIFKDLSALPSFAFKCNFPSSGFVFLYPLQTVWSFSRLLADSPIPLGLEGPLLIGLPLPRYAFVPGRDFCRVKRCDK